MNKGRAQDSISYIASDLYVPENKQKKYQNFCSLLQELTSRRDIASPPVSIFVRVSLSKLPPPATSPSPPLSVEKPLCRQLVAGYSKGLMELKL
uniref:Uncharacterized protein n=1 Tax=Cucumis melo TaxID=3656 RepID=A0A9I9EEU6_CUCME